MTAIATTEQERHRLDIGLVFTKGWKLFVKDIGPLLIGALIACALSVLTLGILAGPLAAGLYGMVDRACPRRPPGTGGRRLRRLRQVLELPLRGDRPRVLIGIASLTIIGGVLLATIWIYVFPLMVDRRMGIGEAMTASKHIVVNTGFWEHVALVGSSSRSSPWPTAGWGSSRRRSRSP